MMSILRPSIMLFFAATALPACAGSDDAADGGGLEDATVAQSQNHDRATEGGQSASNADAPSGSGGDGNIYAGSGGDSQEGDAASGGAGAGADAGASADAGSGGASLGEIAGGGGAEAAAAGAGGADPVVTAGGGSPVPPPIDPGAPSYEVPVSGELAAFAQYPVAGVEWTTRNGERRLEYNLPADLVGADQRLELKGPDSAGTQWDLQGETFGSAQCELMDTQIVCREMLDGVPIDLNAVQAKVQAGSLPPERLEVSKVFQGDPLGILRFPAP